MCGIFLSVRRTAVSKNPHVHKEIKAAIDKRGDFDCSSSHVDTIDTSGQFWTLEFYASVLSLRSCVKSLQPLVDTAGNVLLFNGEIFEYEDENETIELNGMKSDTEYLYQKLNQSSDMENILSVISSIRGPYSFIFYDKSEERLYFGRDFIGRRSLILFQSSEEIIISSVSCEASHLNDLYRVSEIKSDGIKYVDFKSFDTKCMNSSYIGIKIDTIKWSSTLSGQQIESNGCKTISPPLMCMKKYQEYDESILDVFINILDESVRKRVTCHDFICNNCIKTDRKEKCFHPSTAILFSGGIDSTIIALLSHRHIPKNIPIDLLNISFDSNAPDRITGIDTVQELRSLCSDRIWNFVEIDIKKEELDTFSSHVKNGLIFPSEGNETVIDESIGCSLWFASRGIGCISEDVSKESKDVSKDVSKIPYKSAARILLSGLGADEQLAGYSRHRRAFDTQGWEGLEEELAMDLDRISSRNLGRDDRVMSDHRKEIRYPFLDEKLISFLNVIPIRYKCNLKLDRGIGEKHLLRQACFKLGLSKERCATLKRAIQFGSRIAHVTRK